MEQQMKINGLSNPRKEKSLPEPFRKIERKAPLIWGRTFDGEVEIHRLWDSGEIATYREKERREAEAKLDTRSPLSDPLAGLTPRERRREAFGYTANQDLNSDARRAISGYTQPTSKGQRAVEPNISELRKKYGVT
jgi:hypothetical protein